MRNRRGALSLGRATALRGAVVTVLLLLGLFRSAGAANTVLHYVDTFGLPGVAPFPAGLVISADGRFLYSADTAAVQVMVRDPLTNDLASLQVAPVDSCYGQALALSRDGHHLYVVCNSFDLETHFIAILVRDPATGLVDQSTTFTFFSGAHSIAVGPDDRFVYLTPAVNYLYARDPVSGMLTSVPPQPGGSMFAPLLLSDVDTWAANPSVAVGGSYGRLSLRRRSVTTGELTYEADIASDLPDGVVALALNPAQTEVHVAGGGYLNTYSVGSGASALISAQAEGKAGLVNFGFPRGIVVTSTGVFATTLESAETSRLFHFRRSPTGVTTAVGSVRGLAYPVGIVASPDERRIYVATRAGTVEMFEEGSVCTDAPRTDCRAATKSLLSYETTGHGPVLRYQWQNGTTSFPLSGDPVGGSTYAICLYDGNGARVLAAMAPQGALTRGRGWKQLGIGVSTGFVYRDRFRVPDGVSTVRLGTQRVTVRGKGLQMPHPSAPLAAPLTAQVMTDFGECWTSHFEAADVRLFDPSRDLFSARTETP